MISFSPQAEAVGGVDQVWPVFNLAEAAIVTGVDLILLFPLRRGRAQP